MSTPTSPTTTPSFRTLWKPRLLVAAALAFVGSLLFLPFLFSGTGTMIMAQDQLRGVGAWMRWAAYLKQGIIPLWWPTILTGTPTFDALVGDGSNPVGVLFMLVVPEVKRVGLMFWAHTLFAGGAAYLLARRQFELSRPVAAGLGSLWMLNTYSISLIYGGHTGKFYILAMLPLLVLGVLRFMDTGKVRWMLLKAGTVGMMLWTCHVQMVYFCLWGAFALWCVGLWEYRRNVKALIGRVAGFWVAILLGVALGAPILYPAMGYVEKSSVRGAEDRTSMEHATSWSMHPEEVASLVVPEFGGMDVGGERAYWGRNPFKLNSETPGAMLLFLGLAGMILLRTRWTWTALVIGVCAILFGLGAHTPFFELCYLVIPGVKKFRAPSMILFWLGMALFLAGAAFLRSLDDRVTSAQQAKRAKVLLWVSVSGAAFALLFAAAPGVAYSLWNGVFDGVFNGPNGVYSLEKAQSVMQLQQTGGFGFGAFRVGAIVAISAFLLRLYWQGDIKKELLLTVWIALGVGDLLWNGKRFIQTIPADQVHQPSPMLEKLASQPDRFRILDWPPGSLGQGFNEYYGLELMNGFSDNELRWTRQFRSEDLSLVAKGLHQTPEGVAGSRVLDLLNVKYLVFRDEASGQEGAVPNITVLPRAWVAHQWEFAGDESDLSRLQDSGFDYRNRILLQPDDKERVGAASGADSALPAQVTEYTPNRVSVQSVAKAPALLYVADAWSDSWFATVDGKPVPVLRANHAYRAIPVPAGSHAVVMEYRSARLILALWVALGALGLLSLLGLVSWRTRGL